MTGRTRFGHNVIDTEQLYDAAITAEKIGTDAVITAKIQDDAVTSDKIAPGVLTQNVRDMVKTAAIIKTAGTIPICTVPAGAYVYRVLTSCRIQFDGDFAITIGDSGNTSGYLANANITKTLNAISGEDPATYGAYLYVPGTQTTTAGALGDWTLSAVHVDSGTHIMDTHTQTTTAGTLPDYTVTAFGHPRVKYYGADTVVNAYVTQTTSTVGTLDVYIHYMRTVMAD